jgi:hypothetical protein
VSAAIQMDCLESSNYILIDIELRILNNQTTKFKMMTFSLYVYLSQLQEICQTTSNGYVFKAQQSELSF